MDKHFKLTEETKVNEAGVTLHRIMATRDSRYAKAGEKGGFVEREDNLGGEAWVDNNAEVWGEAFVYCYAYVSGNARVYGNAQVYDHAWVGADARVYDNARVHENAYVGGQANAERLEEELMDEAIVRAAHPLYVELLRAQARIDAMSEAIEIIMNS